MTALSTILSQWYENDRMLYSVVSMGAMVVVGALLGLAMDWLGRRLGVDTSTLHHHREKVRD